MGTLNVGILLFNDIELLDFAGPYEVFTVAADATGGRLMDVFTVTEDGRAIRTVNGLRVSPDYGFGDCPHIDLLIVPGGVGTRLEMTKEPVLTWLKERHETAGMTMSVCSGARLLGCLGLLDGLEVTTHHTVMADLRVIAPRAIIRDDVRYIDNGRILTSAGVSAGIDLSLHVVAKLFGKAAADGAMAYMEYGDWQG